MIQVSPDRLSFFSRAYYRQKFVITHDIIGYIRQIDVEHDGVNRVVRIGASVPLFAVKPFGPEVWDIALRLANWRRKQFSAVDRHPMTDAPCTIKLPGRCCS